MSKLRMREPGPLAPDGARVVFVSTTESGMRRPTVQQRSAYKPLMFWLSFVAEGAERLARGNPNAFGQTCGTVATRASAPCRLPKHSTAVHAGHLRLASAAEAWKLTRCQAPVGVAPNGQWRRPLRLLPDGGDRFQIRHESLTQKLARRFPWRMHNAVRLTNVRKT